MRRPRALLAGTAGAACLVLIASVAGGSAATPNDDVHYFEAFALGSGSAVADYGEDRKMPGQITASGVDGKESLHWRWEVRAVARSTGAGPLLTRASAGRMRAVLQVSIVSYGIQMGVLGEEQLCDFNGTSTFLSTDGENPIAKKSGPGELVHSVGFRLSGGELIVTAPAGSGHGCIHGTEGDGELNFVEGSGYDDARVPRGAFNPRSDSSFERTYRSGPISLDRSHYGDPNAVHTFNAESRLEVKFEAISERRFNKLVRKYQHIPVHGRGEGEVAYYEPPG
jgi:hypothetical protein